MLLVVSHDEYFLKQIHVEDSMDSGNCRFEFRIVSFPEINTAKFARRVIEH